MIIVVIHIDYMISMIADYLQLIIIDDPIIAVLH